MKVRKFTNDKGMNMEFDADLPDEVIKERLNWMCKNWREIKEENEQNEK